MWKALIDKSRLTDWVVASATLVIAVVAILQWFILTGQLKEMRNDRRAFISPDLIPFQIEEGKPTLIPVVIENIGKTPARNVTGYVRPMELAQGEDPSFDYTHTKHTFGIGAIFPGRRFEIPFRLIQKQFAGSEQAFTMPLTHETYERIVSGQSFIVIHGKITYDDVYGVTHWVTFCAMGRPDNYLKYSGAKQCAEYTNIDKN